MATAGYAVRSTESIFHALHEARARTLDLVGDLSDQQMIGPRMEIVNPLRWEVGHVAWFHEFWVLRHFRQQPALSRQGDRLYDSARIAHDTRWDLPLPSKDDTLRYLQQVLARIVSERSLRWPDARREVAGYREEYYLTLGLYHEYMHAEAITYTRQTLGYPAPRMGTAREGGEAGAANVIEALGDAEVPGGVYGVGSTRDHAFVFDNEQWAHSVTLKPFRIARAAVTNEDFLAFVEDRGYRRREWWTDKGWEWRESESAEHPVYWKKEASGRWLRRHFDQWVKLEPGHPVLHVNWYEADAYCRWAGRRLPTEAEWETAASFDPRAGRKRMYPWGNEEPSASRANLDWRSMGTIPVDALPAGDSAFGCRQMIGNTWEWTSTDFGPYPGFRPGPYKEYSAPWFTGHKVLRGGAWTTRSAMIRSTYRNYYPPHRRDVWAGFRTCALD